MRVVDASFDSGASRPPMIGRLLSRLIRISLHCGIWWRFEHSLEEKNNSELGPWFSPSSLNGSRLEI